MVMSTENIVQATTDTGYIYTYNQLVKMETGIQSGSTARINYVRSAFNPLYSKLYFKMRLNDMDGVTMFAGLKHGIDAPYWGMTDSCAGIYIDWKNDAQTLYFYTANGDSDYPNFQATPIKDIDMTRWLVFEIDGYKMRYYSLPYTVPYFDENVPDGLRQGIIRKWSNVYTNGSYIPNDSMHYIYFYIQNHTGDNKFIEIQKINYAEVYPD